MYLLCRVKGTRDAIVCFPIECLIDYNTPSNFSVHDLEGLEDWDYIRGPQFCLANEDFPTLDERLTSAFQHLILPSTWNLLGDPLTGMTISLLVLATQSLSTVNRLDLAIFQSCHLRRESCIGGHHLYFIFSQLLDHFAVAIL